MTEDSGSGSPPARPGGANDKASVAAWWFVPARYAVVPGLALALAVAFAGRLAEPYAKTLGEAMLAIGFGFVVANLLRPGLWAERGLVACEKQVLGAAIALLGIELELATLTRLGLGTVAVVVAAVAGTILAGLAIGRLCGLGRPLALLIAVGNAICGITAIAVIAPLATKDREDIGLAVSVVSLLGACGLVLVPLIGRFAGLDGDGLAVLIGTTLQAVGHVVAAGFAVGDDVGRAATVVKMGRVALLAPVVLVLSYVLRGRTEGAPRGAIPAALWGLIIVGVLKNVGAIPAGVEPYVKALGKLLLLWGLAGIGLRIRVAGLVKQGPRALAAGAVLFALTIAAVTVWLRV